MTALFLALALATGDQDMTGPESTTPPQDPNAAQNVFVANDPRPTLQLTLVWPEGKSAGLWLSEDQAIRNAQRLHDAEVAAQQAAVPWWLWVAGGVVVGGIVGYGAHALIGGGK